MRIPSAILACAMLTLASCSSSQSGKGEADSVVSSAKKPSAPSMNLDSLAEVRRTRSPNVFRIVGTVVAVEPPGAGGSTGPCAKAPCMASVRIDSLFHHDSSTAYPFAVGQRVRMRFAFTLGPSSEAFPKRATAYPGLKAGSSFEADVTRVRPKEGGDGAGEFIVAAYTVR